MIISTVLTSAAAAMSSYLSASFLCRHALVLGFADKPNERSLHVRVTPRGGGIGFAIFVPTAIVLQELLIGGRPATLEVVLLVAALLVALVGFADDRGGLSVPVKFAAHSCAALIVMAAGGVIREIQIPGFPAVQLGILAWPATLAWFIGLTNVYNFMDGIDGLAAAQGIVAAASIAVLAACVGRPEVAAAMTILAAGVIGFIVLNWQPARIFMGDVGSTFLGFTFAGWAVLTGETRDGALPLVAWIAVLSPFLFDACLTLIVRAYRRQRLYQAHRDHIYQRLVRRGWSHARTAILYGALAASAGGLTVAHYGLRLVDGPTYLLLTILLIPLPLLGLAIWARR